MHKHKLASIRSGLRIPFTVKRKNENDKTNQPTTSVNFINHDVVLLILFLIYIQITLIIIIITNVSYLQGKSCKKYWNACARTITKKLERNLKSRVKAWLWGFLYSKNDLLSIVGTVLTKSGFSRNTTGKEKIIAFNVVKIVESHD